MADKIVFVATAWGSKYGGINAFNEDLAVATSQLLSPQYDIFSVALDATKKEIASAESRGVKLISIDAGRRRDSFENRDLKLILSKISAAGTGKIAWWVGHDVITGSVAIEASRVQRA